MKAYKACFYTDCEVFFSTFEEGEASSTAWGRKNVALLATHSTFEVHFRVCHLKNATH